jgi:putative DNA methylase
MRKLIETSLPLEAVSRASRADKNRKTGTVRNLHKWFAPMPAPAWRALLVAALLDDPQDEEQRKRLLAEISALLPADGSAPPQSAVSAIQKSLATNHDNQRVVVLDPFVGGGSTLIEAQRLDLDTVGCDINPVPALIARFLTELVPALSDLEPLIAELDGVPFDPITAFEADVALLADEIRSKTLHRIGDLYPPLGDATPFAWLWCHDIPCPNPACGRRIPLHASNRLSTMRGEEAYLAHEVTDVGIEFRIVANEVDASRPTKVPGRRGQFLCPACETGIDDEAIKKRSDELRVRPMAIACQTSNRRVYFGSLDYERSFCDQLSPPDIDETELPVAGLGLRVQAYGFRSYEDLFLPRQQRMLLTFAEVVREAADRLLTTHPDDARARALAAFFGLCIGKMAHVSSKQATWRTRNGPPKAEAAFGQSVLPMVWDFAEVNPFGGSVGDWLQIVKTALRALRALPRTRAGGCVLVGDARRVDFPLRPNDAVLVATDPPYFDAIGYADLSDYFYIWHRRALREIWPDLYATAAAPRDGELIADPDRHHGDMREATTYFIRGFTETFRRLASISSPDLPILVVYAHQQRERSYGEFGSTGWEAMLQSVVNAGLMLTASWPVHCTSETRLRGQDSNALASYVVLACRPRSQEFGAVTRRGFIAALNEELPTALRKLQQGAIAPVDLSQAAIGPGMAVFTRYSNVVEADGSIMSVRTALALINQVLDEVLSEQEGDFDSDTRFCVKWFTQFGWEESSSGNADSLARSTNTAVEGLVRGGVFWARAGRARLLTIDELSEPWDPITDTRISVWELVLRLVKALNEQGADEAARLMHLASRRVDLDTANELAHLLFKTCEKKGWAEGALLFNGLGTSWLDLTSVARGAGSLSRAAQGALDFETDDEE